MPSERNQTQNATYPMISFKCSGQSRQIYRAPKCINGCQEVEND